MTQKDHWSQLEDAAAVAKAVDRLKQVAAAPSEIAARERIFALMRVRPGQHVLDVGAGIGTFAQPLAEQIAPDGRLVAFDPSEALLAQFPDSPSIEKVVGDARDLPFDDDDFDHAFCHWVLLHVDPMQAIVNEMHRVVRPGGLVTCVEVDWETATVHPGERDLTRTILNASTDRSVDGWAGRRLVPLLRDAGLADVAVEPIVDVQCDETSGGWLPFLESRVEIAVTAGRISASDGHDWWTDIARAAREQRYFFSVTQFVVRGRKPTPQRTSC